MLFLLLKVPCSAKTVFVEEHASLHLFLICPDRPLSYIVDYTSAASSKDVSSALHLVDEEDGCTPRLLCILV